MAITFSVVVFVLSMISVVVFSIIAYEYLGGFRKTPWICSVVCIIQWILTLSYIALIPVDYDIYMQKNCLQRKDPNCSKFDTFLNNDTALFVLWTLLYWITFIFDWLDIIFCDMLIILGLYFHTFRVIIVQEVLQFYKNVLIL
jgi:hypothetical protein